MCGIIARIGKQISSFEITSKLRGLEYRGYDSFGVLSVNTTNVENTDDLKIVKDVGVITDNHINLHEKSTIQIAHTRWATHGGVSVQNAHPHSSQDNKFQIVMNGIVENSDNLKNVYLKEYNFNSQTDTEVIVALFQQELEENSDIQLHTLCSNIFSKLKGNFACTIVYNNFLVVYKRGNPLILGINYKEEQMYICSDNLLLQEFVDEYKIIEDKELYILSLNNIEKNNFDKNSTHKSFLSLIQFQYYTQRNLQFIEELNIKGEEFSKYIECTPVNKNVNTLQNIQNLQSLDSESILFDFLRHSSKKSKLLEKISYKILKSSNDKLHYSMVQEILEQSNCMNLITQEHINSSIELYQKILLADSIYIIGAGTSYYAGLELHYSLLEQSIMSYCCVASEFDSYKEVILQEYKREKSTLVIVFSQSGETADIIYPLSDLKESLNGIKSKKTNNQIKQGQFEIVTITNTQYSTLDRMALTSLYLNCGREVAVASTKAFMHQLLISYILEEIHNYITNNNESRNKIKKKNVGENSEEFREKDIKKFQTRLMNHLVNQFKKFELLILEYISQNYNQILLDVQEISYIKNIFFIGKKEFYPLSLEGALKLKEVNYNNANGYVAGELKHGSLALVEEGTPVIVLSNIQETYIEECRSRGAKIFIPPLFSDKNYFYESVISRKIQYTLYVQLLAFECACERGNNPDRPRNLAKSVTVR
ncbi:MAG: SIS domain-containing protein [Candidatus Woesearchaeota archaeon]